MYSVRKNCSHIVLSIGQNLPRKGVQGPGQICFQSLETPGILSIVSGANPDYIIRGSEKGIGYWGKCG